MIFGRSKWICTGRHIVNRDTGYMSPAVQFRKTFFIKNPGYKSICRICGLGCYVLYVNGERVGDDVLSPPFTDYDKRAIYVEYDLSGVLKEGKNVVAVKLGNGFYNQTATDCWGFFSAKWRENPNMVFEIVSDGKTVCVSDDSWKFTTNGATYHNDVRTGEYYDARKEDGWTGEEYDDGSWSNAVESIPPCGRLDKMTMPFIRECAAIDAVDKIRSEKGWIFDFGVNISGYVSIDLEGKRGRVATIRYAEKLNGNEIDQSNINCFVKEKEVFSTDKYIFKGEGREFHKPEFVYHGFRYVEISGLEDEPPLSALKAYWVHTDLRRKGFFRCSDETLNWAYDAGVRSFLNNFHGFSEDCPHREKNGWTGDAAVSCGYAVTLFDMKEAYKKWLTDICDAQRENGQLPGIAPTSGWGFNWGGGPAWDCALFFLPYELYRESGDTECLDVIFKTAKKYLAYADKRRKNGLVCYGIPDWCPPDDVEDLRIMSNELSDSCYYYGMLKTMSEICSLKGMNGQAGIYARKAEKIRKAIKDKYIRGDVVDNDGQGALAEVLYFGIVEGEQATAIAEKLAKTLRRDGYVCKVGILGMKAMFNSLSEYGYTADMYRAVTRKEPPSYGYWKECGATTLWERWKLNEVASLNHHMYGEIVNWVFRYVGGIRNDGVAYDKCTLAPFFFAENCSCESRVGTVKGEIYFGWKKTNGQFEAEITLPEGVTAELIVGKSKETIYGSEKTITIKKKTD